MEQPPGPSLLAGAKPRQTPSHPMTHACQQGFWWWSHDGIGNILKTSPTFKIMEMQFKQVSL